MTDDHGAATTTELIVNEFRFRGGVALQPTGDADGGNRLFGVSEFTFWNRDTPDQIYTMKFIGSPGVLREIGDIVRHGVRHVANRIERGT